jgi:hypothetical protein
MRFASSSAARLAAFAALARFTNSAETARFPEGAGCVGLVLFSAPAAPGLERKVGPSVILRRRAAPGMPIFPVRTGDPPQVRFEGRDMKRRHLAIAPVLILLAASTAHAGGFKGIDPLSALSALSDTSLASLSGSLRALLLQTLPTPLYVNETHWGQQKEVQVGVTWKGSGLNIHAEPRMKLKNDGKWWKVRVTAPNLADTLVFDLRDVQTPEPGRLLFTAFASFDVNADYERQDWDDGVRLLSTEVRGRMRVKLTLHCEATSRTEKNGALPEVVFRLRVVKAECAYDNLVVEHIAGVGGELAKLIGDATLGGMKQWHPSFEKHLLEKADAAIVKAGDTKEVRLSLGKLFGAKK